MECEDARMAIASKLNNSLFSPRVLRGAYPCPVSNLNLLLALVEKVEQGQGNGRQTGIDGPNGNCTKLVSIAILVLASNYSFSSTSFASR